LGQQRLEHASVDGVGVDTKAVSGADGLERLGSQALPDLRDVSLQRLAGGTRWVAAPQLLDEVVRRHDLVRMQEEDREQLPLLPAADRDGAVGVVHLEWTENRELHRCTRNDRTTSPGAR